MVGGVHRKSRRHINYHRSHRVPLRVQQDHEVTILALKHRETEAILQKSKKEGNNKATRSRLRDLPEWLEVISKVQKCQHSDTRLMGMSSESGSYYTHSSQKTEIATSASEQRLRWAPCRKRTGEAVPRAERYDTTTSVLSWYKILPLNGCSLLQCRTKTSQETERRMRKFLEPSEKPKVMYIDNFFGKACEDLSWNHCPSTLHRSETNEATRSRLRGLPDWLEVISKIQTCRHPHTLLMTQVRNVLRKWHPGSTVFVLTSQKTEMAKSASEQILRGLLAGSALAKQYLGPIFFGTERLKRNC